MMKSIVAATVAVSFLAVMGIAQAGVPTAQPTHAVVAASAHAPVAVANSGPSNAAQQPTVPGAATAQSHAMSTTAKVLIGVGIAAGVILIASTSGGGSSSSPSSGPSGPTGTQ